jgi:hypothetical protein
LFICGYERGVELFSLPDFKPLWKIDDFVVERFAASSELKHYGLLHPCIVFHPLENVVFAGQLTPVLNLEGKFESGRIVQCEEIPNKFTNCCFAHDNTKMVTNYGKFLTVWNLLKNKKIVSLSCRSELISILFSTNDRFIGTTNINELCVYDTENSYSMVSRSFDAGNFAVLVSTFYSDSWFVKNLIMASRKIEIVKYDLTIKPVAEPVIGVRPANARAAAKFQAVVESDDSTWFDKLLGCGDSFFMLSNESVLIHRNVREIELCRLTELTQNSNKKKQGIKFISSLGFVKRFSVSVDGRYIYVCTGFKKTSLSIVKLSRPRSVKRATISFEDVIRKMFRTIRASTWFFPVTNGVFLLGEIRKSSTGKYKLCASNPELWNIGVTQRLASFPELTGTSYCVSVSQDLVACIMESQVCFFNVLKKAIVARTPFPEHILVSLREHKLKKIEVIACSSLYHVLMGNTEYSYLLQCGNSVDLNSCVFNNIIPEVVSDIIAACFSPDGQSLAILDWETLYIVDIATLNIRGKISPNSVSTSQMPLEFVDEEHLLCERYNYCLCLIMSKLVTY